MSLFSSTRKLKKDYSAFGVAGKESYDYGRGITDETLGGLRGDLKLFDSRLNNPLGDETKGIFQRARGMASDNTVQRQRSFGASLAERARQSGGTLSPAAIAELEQQTQRDLAESEFKDQFAIDSEQAALTLTETNRLFDRRADIRKTMLGIGDAKEGRGLEMWLQSLSSRERDIQSRRNMIMGLFGASVSGASAGAGGGATGGGNPGG